MNSVSFDTFKSSMIKDIQSSKSIAEMKYIFEGNLALVHQAETPCQWSASEIPAILAECEAQIVNGKGYTQEEFEEYINTLNV